MVEDKSRLWGNQHPYFETATVTVTRVSDGGNLIIGNRYSDTSGYGVPNVLSWQVEGWKWEAEGVSRRACYRRKRRGTIL